MARAVREVRLSQRSRHRSRQRARSVPSPKGEEPDRGVAGGDPGIQRSLKQMHHDDPDGMYAKWGVEPAVAEYMGKAMAALSQEEGPAL